MIDFNSIKQFVCLWCILNWVSSSVITSNTSLVKEILEKHQTFFLTLWALHKSTHSSYDNFSYRCLCMVSDYPGRFLSVMNLIGTCIAIFFYATIFVLIKLCWQSRKWYVFCAKSAKFYVSIQDVITYHMMTAVIIIIW